MGGKDGGDGLQADVAPQPNIPAANFVITEDVQLGKGGEVEKFNDKRRADSHVYGRKRTRK